MGLSVAVKAQGEMREMLKKKRRTFQKNRTGRQQLLDDTSCRFSVQGPVARSMVSVNQRLIP